jgi:hypothetical protein
MHLTKFNPEKKQTMLGLLHKILRLLTLKMFTLQSFYPYLDQR